MTRFTNLIAGTSVPSKAGLFALASRALGQDGKCGGELGQWPRSGAREVMAALDGLEGQAPGQQLAGLDQLEAGWQELLSMVTGSSGLGAPNRGAQAAIFDAGLDQLHSRLGISRSSAQELLFQGHFSSFGFGAREFPRGGAVAVFCHWSEPLRTLFTTVAECLFRGRPVLLLPDPDLPMAGAAIAQALLAVGLDPASIAVLHALDTEGWMALAGAADQGRCPQVMGRISVDKKRELAAYGQHNPGLQALLLSLLTPVESQWLAPAALGALPLDSAQIRKAASALARAAFGPGCGFGGVAHGAPLVARIPRQAFSAFTNAMVAELDALPFGKYPPLAFLGPGGRHSVRARYDELWKRGLDEGATLVTGGTTKVHSTDGGHLHPALLVNIDGDSGLFDLGEPLGVLRLQRA
ncbi:MAG: aldehyde dehydrogenase family protein [Planctomycetota bacterium]|nr:aldehyde dehydrogenase family protein [Planctomycetota bacterium]